MIVFWFIVALGCFWCGLMGIWEYRTNLEFRSMVKRYFKVMIFNKKLNFRDRLKYYGIR